jgi:RNA polymerase sigma-70 factor (ECF subfamily)
MALDSLSQSKGFKFPQNVIEEFITDPMVEKEDRDFIDLKAEIAMEAIQKLSPAYRAVFNLFVLEDYSHKEIGQLLGISEGTSKSNLAKAKMNLQKILNEKFMNIR